MSAVYLIPQLPVVAYACVGVWYNFRWLVVIPPPEAQMACYSDGRSISEVLDGRRYTYYTIGSKQRRCTFGTLHSDGGVGHEKQYLW